MPEPATLPTSGLVTTARAAVPLTGVSIRADLCDLCARVVVTQRYVNTEPTPIEAVYLFPLDEAAAVCGFEAIVDGTLVVGEVKPREEAFAAYDDAMQRGDGGFLLDEERPDVFQASVGNLPPGAEVLLKITYVAELPVADGAVRFVIPTTVSPRYAPGEDRAGVGRPDAETLNPPSAWSVPYGLDLAVRVATSGRLGRIESPSHPIGLALEDGGAVVTLSQRDAALDRDFVLAIEAAALDEPRAWIERGEDGSEAVAIAFVPSLPERQAAAEVIFLVDRSGSMGGASIEEVRNALQLCLRSLSAGSRFNIIGFGSSTQALFPSSREYGDDTLAAATAHVASLDADLGGTEILPALKQALAPPPVEGLPRQLVVLTDGEVSNTDAVIALAASHAADARIFTFGIGAGASHHLVKGLARAGGGSAEFIFPGERIEPKVVRQLGRLLSPALTNVRVEWGGLDVTQAPGRVPPVFAGGRLLVYGLLRGAATQPGTVRLRAEGPSGPLSFDVRLDPREARAGSVVATLAARVRIRELEEGPEWLASRGSRQRGRKATAATAEIVALAVRYGLVSRETSYVAIERRDTPVLGDVQLRRVPIALTTGWGGMDRIAPMSVAHTGVYRFTGAYRLKPMPDVSLERAAPDLEASDGDSLMAPEAYVAAPQWSPSRFDKLRALRTPPDPRHREMLELVRQQRADGGWDLSARFAAALDYPLADLEAALPGVTGGREEAQRAWATALALAWLERQAMEWLDDWRLLADKARRWLDRTRTAPASGERWFEAAVRFLARS
jgi:Ca-activated chloride channel homolog